MLTLHYNSSNGYPSNGSDNGGGSNYLDYTTLTNMSTDRLNESSKSPLVGGHSIVEGAGSAGSSAGDAGAAYGYFESLENGTGASGYGHSPVGPYSQAGTSKSPSYEYSMGSAVSQTASAVADGYSTAAEHVTLGGQHSLLPPPLHHHYQISVTIGPGTSQQRTLPVIYDQMQISKDTYGAFLSIIEQPTNRIRYRYRSEKGSHGGLNGENSSQLKKTYPTIKVENYRQSSAIYIRASLATNEGKPKPHVHKLMGRHCSEDGACTLPVAENLTTIFQNLGILFIGKKEVPEILYKRKLTDFQSRYFNQSLTEKVRESLREQSEKEAKDMNLNSVKICFEAFVLQNEALYPICSPVYSRPIANQKSPDSGELKIIRINRYCGTVAGGDEVYLLCEKVNKKEIRVRFFEVDSEGNQQWEAFGHFNESDVHHQVAIVFRTPPYRDQSIGKPTQVYLQLYRQRDGEFSEPRTFIYKPKGDTSSDFSGEVLLSTKSGLQECVLTRIRMENQPPGYKRRKYSHQNGGSAKLGKSSGSGGNGGGGSGRGHGHVASENSAGTSAAGTSYLQRKGANKHSRVQVKVQSAPQEVTIKTEHDQEMCPLNSSSTVVAGNNSNSSFTGAGQGGHLEGSFCQAPLPIKSSFSVASNKCSTSHFSALGRPSMASASLSLPSPTSHSCSSSTPSSPTSATSLMLSTALQQTVLVDQTTVTNSGNAHNNQQQQQPQHHQHQHQHSDSLDFDHLDSMWTPPSEPSPPLSAGDFFHSFLPMSATPSSAAAAASVHSLANGPHQAVTFVDLSNNNIDHQHHHHHLHHHQQQQQQQQHPHLQHLSIVSLDVATAPSISLSPPLSTPSPSIVSSNTCTSIQQQQQQQQPYSGSICMLYS